VDVRGLTRLTAVPGGVRLEIRVVPRARRSGVDGIRDGRLLIRVTAPPVDRAANDSTLTVLADALGVPRRDLRLVAGETARNKVVEIASVDVATVRARLIFRSVP
jgi:hypothetical protein